MNVVTIYYYFFILKYIYNEQVKVKSIINQWNKNISGEN